jgi:formate dehydrogenase iron-sulfur subunit
MFFLEPLIEVETAQGRIGYGPVSASSVASLFDAGLLTGGAHSLRIGNPEEHPFLAGQTRLTFARCGIVDPLSLSDYAAHDGWKGLKRALEIEPSAIVAEVTKSGLRGRGGAGFPTGIKWKTVADTAADRKYIVCNADEGDSGTFADRMIMEGDPFALIEGMTICGIGRRRDQGLCLLPVGISPCRENLFGGPADRAGGGLPRPQYPRVGTCLRARVADGRRCLYMRRGNVSPRKPGRQTRHRAGETALAGA